MTEWSPEDGQLPVLANLWPAARTHAQARRYRPYVQERQGGKGAGIRAQVGLDFRLCTADIWRLGSAYAGQSLDAIWYDSWE